MNSLRTAAPAAATPAQSPAMGRWLILAEVLGFVALALGSRYLVSLVTWRFAGPISLIFTLVILTAYLRGRGIGWRDMGVRALPGLKAKLLLIPQTALTGMVFFGAVAAVLIGGPAIGLDFIGQVPDTVEDRWGDLEGNLPLFLLWLAIVWTVAAFGEEMFFRGYLITRLETAFADIRWGVVLAVLLPALLFGYGHYYYQGLSGVVVTGTIGLVLGIMFVLFRRNLWPVILWHGIIDTLAFTATFMNWDI
ncbi:CPBP family intramembrane glutamic endopeptidase [Parasphingopyxis lamellibrachiae]|uniref:CAAX prenyl protease-like protein n=1 Tax=Parasphingopyxis lamellibrachiae TaxID=680125 RepID=A0A3D9FDZ3_9SPHN|nr:CPBP family intramembrane glutamic endopeptidase [Parasphingopyxis lamellibrachiae]RED16054.1 CAAX prenyl protease-like protein [Parasphingopyxis lamellibrachiae]